MGMLKVSSVLVILADSLVSGFTCGAACHVVTSQVKSLFGIEFSKHTGLFKIVTVSYSFLFLCNTYIIHHSSNRLLLFFKPQGPNGMVET